MSLDTIPSTEGGKFKAIASGTLPNGKPVVVNADGTVGVVALGEASSGTPAVFESAATDFIAATFDSSSNKVFIGYEDEGNSSFGTAVVGTVSGSSITFGAPVVFASEAISNIAADFDSTANKVVIAYRSLVAGSAGFTFLGHAIVGTVSGTTISFGTSVSTDDYNDSSTVTYDSNSDKTVITYRVGNDGGFFAKVGTVSGTSISFGARVSIFPTDARNARATFDSNSNKVVIGFTDDETASSGTIKVGTVSGTSISFGAAAVFRSGAGGNFDLTFDSNSNKVVVAYEDLGNSGFGTARVGTVSGTSISFGTPVVFESASTDFISATFDSTSNKVVLSYRDEGNSGFGTARVGTVSGTSISFGTPLIFESAATLRIVSTFDNSSNRVAIAYRDNGNASFGTAVVFTAETPNLTAENYIGISSGGAVADTGNATVDIVGTINRDQLGLTAGQQYYVQTDGTLSETPADPSVLAGTAVSATKLVVKS